MRRAKTTLASFLERHGTTVEAFRARYAYTANLDLVGWAWEFWRRQIISGAGIRLPMPLVGSLPEDVVHPHYRMTGVEIRERGVVRASITQMGCGYTPIRQVPWRSELVAPVDADSPPGEVAEGHEDRLSPLTDAPQLDLVEKRYRSLAVLGAGMAHRYPLVWVDLGAPRDEIVAAFNAFLDEQIPRATEENPWMDRPKQTPAGRDAANRWHEGDYLPIWDLHTHNAPAVCVYREFFGVTEDDRKKHARILNECQELIHGTRGQALRDLIGGAKAT